MAEITYDKSDENFLGRGPHLTLVYKGKFGERDVAVKVVPKTDFKMYNFLQDITTLKESDWHDNILSYFHNMKKKDNTLIALELCDTNLQKWVEGPLDGKLLPNFPRVEILRQATSGVAHLHDRRIVHRNIKPENVLLRSHPPNGIRVKICDFGFSKALKDDSNHSASGLSGMSMGYETTAWMSPEVLRNREKPGSEPLTSAVDVFSLGCLYYYVFSDGQHPFRFESNFDIASNILRGAINRIVDFKHAHPDNLDHIKCMLDSDPEKRPKLPEILVYITSLTQTAVLRPMDVE